MSLLRLSLRVSDSDDLSMSEGEVGKLAVSIEKEMFNLYLNTDNKYKNKYRSLMFNLKDPKNKVSPIIVQIFVFAHMPEAESAQKWLGNVNDYYFLYIRVCFIV